MIKLSEWVSKVNSMLRSLRPIDSKDIFFVKTPEGFEARLQKKAEESARGGGGGGGGQSSFICKITGSFGEGIYAVEVHPKGKDSNEGVYTAVAVLLNQQYDGPLLIGSWVIAVEGELTNT